MTMALAALDIGMFSPKVLEEKMRRQRRLVLDRYRGAYVGDTVSVGDDAESPRVKYGGHCRVLASVQPREEDVLVSAEAAMRRNMNKDWCHFGAGIEGVGPHIVERLGTATELTASRASRKCNSDTSLASIQQEDDFISDVDPISVGADCSPGESSVPSFSMSPLPQRNIIATAEGVPFVRDNSLLNSTTRAMASSARTFAASPRTGCLPQGRQPSPPSSIANRGAQGFPLGNSPFQDGLNARGNVGKDLLFGYGVSRPSVGVSQLEPPTTASCGLAGVRLHSAVNINESRGLSDAAPLPPIRESSNTHCWKLDENGGDDSETANCISQRTPEDSTSDSRAQLQGELVSQVSAFEEDTMKEDKIDDGASIISLESLRTTVNRRVSTPWPSEGGLRARCTLGDLFPSFPPGFLEEDPSEEKEEEKYVGEGRSCASGRESSKGSGTNETASWQRSPRSHTSYGNSGAVGRLFDDDTWSYISNDSATSTVAQACHHDREACIVERRSARRLSHFSSSLAKYWKKKPRSNRIMPVDPGACVDEVIRTEVCAIDTARFADEVSGIV
eukprot:TRINITY_DN33269_c0_g1_i1.p1 TRINITY_DN33269_c0_g1~~TRINITY_DN33269_c0_g1_i1.p1  ORF type:complete len:561 (+),score=66.33 TRINITY_DN33269_c0_g1_i1:230-1912(+)